MHKKIGVTGASGFIGKRLVQSLLAEGFDVTVLVRSHHKFPNNIRVVVGELEDASVVRDFLTDIDSVVHLAARQLPPEELFFQANVATTDMLVKQMVDFPIKHLVYVSTIAVYGDQSKKLSEDDSCFPTTTYGLTKYMGEILCQYWQSKTQKKLTILRPFNTYGKESTKGVIYNMINKIKHDQAIVVYGDGKQTRDFIYVDDVVNAILISLKKGANGTYNIGSGEDTSLLELIEYMKKTFTNKIKVEFHESERGKSKNISYSIKKIRDELGWKPSVSIEKGLKKFIDE